MHGARLQASLSLGKGRRGGVSGERRRTQWSQVLSCPRFIGPVTKKQRARTTADISYWKGKGEVDFVVNTARGVTPIQVTYGDPQPRHEEALEEFFQLFPHANEAVYVTPKSFDSFTALEL